MIQGIDTSRWQDNPATPSTIDWVKAKQAGISFAILKSSEGNNYIDPVFALHKRNIRGVMPVGAFHYWRPAYDAHAQAKFFYSVAGDMELPPFLDVENFYGDLPSGVGLVNKVIEMMEEIRSVFGRPPIIYTAPNIIKMMGPAAGKLTVYSLWIANYGISSPLIAPWTRWAFWQYSDRAPAAPYGISEAGTVDINYYNGSLDDLYKEFGLVMPLPASDDPVVPPAPPAVPADQTTREEAFMSLLDAIGGLIQDFREKW